MRSSSSLARTAGRIPLVLIRVAERAHPAVSMDVLESRCLLSGSPLDAAFGSDGIVTANLNGQWDQAGGLVIQPDGKLVIANGRSKEFGAVRFNADGSIDTSFGTAGKVSTSFTGYSTRNARAVALQPDGKIVVAGTAGYHEFALARYNPDGSPDNTFDTDGQVTTLVNAGSASIQAIAIQPDGKIVAAGHSADQNDAKTYWTVARYNPDGSLDSTFGAAGLLSFYMPEGTSGAESVVLQPDGKVLLAGYSRYDFAVARLNADGSFDAAFGHTGTSVTDLGGADIAHAMALQSDGKILLAGATSDANQMFALARLNADGSPDSAFGAGGIATADFSTAHHAYDGTFAQANAIAVQDDGKILLGGYEGRPNSPADFALARFNPDGSPDTSFGTSGRAVTDIGGADYGQAMAIQADGDILLAGSTQTTIVAIGMARYLPASDASADTTRPTAALNAPAISAPASTCDFSVTYSDNVGIDAASLADGNLFVQAPDGQKLPVTLVSTGTASGGSLTATYRLAGPDQGAFTFNANGLYTVGIKGFQIFDTSGNPVPAGSAGTFAVAIPNDTAPPAATVSAAALTAPVADYTFTVTYTDDNAVSVATLGNNDVLVSRAGSAPIAAQFVSVNTNTDGTPRIATYRVPAPGGSWDRTDNGAYTISLAAGAVTDILGRAVPAGNIGSFQVSIPEPDTTPPTATVKAAAVTKAGAKTFTVTVTYTDPALVNRSSILKSNLQITGPRHYVATATKVTISSAANSSRLVATYTFTAPGGAWDTTDNGAYTISMRSKQVSDVPGHFVAAGKLGTFSVSIKKKTASR